MREQMMRRRKLLRNPLFNYVLLMFHFITFYLRSTLNYDNFLFFMSSSQRVYKCLTK